MMLMQNYLSQTLTSALHHVIQFWSIFFAFTRMLVVAHFNTVNKQKKLFSNFTQISFKCAVCMFVCSGEISNIYFN